MLLAATFSVPRLHLMPNVVGGGVNSKKKCQNRASAAFFFLSISCSTLREQKDLRAKNEAEFARQEEDSKSNLWAVLLAIKFEPQFTTLWKK